MAYQNNTNPRLTNVQDADYWQRLWDRQEAAIEQARRPPHLRDNNRRTKPIQFCIVINQRQKSHYGDMNPTKAKEIRNLYFREKLTQCVIAEMFGLTQGSVSRIVCGKSWPL